MSITANSYSAPSSEISSIKTGKGNGSQAVQTYCCIKNRAWDILLSSEGQTIDFREGTLSGNLFYYNQSAKKSQEIRCGTGQSVQLDFSPSNDGETCSVAVKIAVLSSQNQGALFVLSFVYCDKQVSSTFVTAPIRVVSKKSQLEKKDKRRTRTTQTATREAVLEMLDRMGKQHEDLVSRLDLLIGNSNNSNNDDVVVVRSKRKLRQEEEFVCEETVTNTRAQKRRSKRSASAAKASFEEDETISEENDNSNDLQCAFDSFISLFSGVDASERESVAQRLLLESSQDITCVQSFLSSEESDSVDVLDSPVPMSLDFQSTCLFDDYQGDYPHPYSDQKWMDEALFAGIF